MRGRPVVVLVDGSGVGGPDTVGTPCVVLRLCGRWCWVSGSADHVLQVGLQVGLWCLSVTGFILGRGPLGLLNLG